MDAFQYKHGDRPLEGYTIQRAVGRGGFGEVYYAVSDSGREVALKVVQGYEDIELRGVSQCMNLKSPHLVTIFDVKRNAEDRPFVIMEYVAGPSLRELLEDAPSGLGTQKAAFFLREIAKGLTFLHDRGIVHRDLKPGNIFYEDGYVKIGDYGLSKAIAASRHTAQTITVGTVHYMAPEIGQGQYDRGIDIYALGVVLYEMLTGQVPFFGSSHGEILMKHLTATPDLTGIEEPFAGVIKRALAKDPHERFQSVQEMVEAVFGAEHIQQSVSHFRPESLSMVAQRVAQKVAVGGPGSSGEHAQGLGPAHQAAQAGSSDIWQDLSQQMDQFGQRMGQWGQRFGEQVAGVGDKVAGRLSGQPTPASPAPATPPVAPGLLDSSLDPLTRGQRRRLWLLTTAVMAIGTSILETSAHGGDAVVTAMAVAAMILGCSIGVFRAGRMLPRLQYEKGIIRYLAFGGTACVAAAVLGFIGLEARIGHSRLRESLLPLLASLFFIDWLGRVTPVRNHRVSFEQTVTAGLVGFIASWFGDGSAVVLIGILTGTSMAVQVGSAFIPPSLQKQTGKPTRPPPADRPRQAEPARPPVAGGGQPTPALRTRPPESPCACRIVGTEMPVVLRGLALLMFVILLGGSIICFVAAGMNTPGDADAFLGFIATGIGAAMLSVFALVKAVQRWFVSWWSSLIKPLLMIACAETIVITAVICLSQPHLSGDETLIATAFIIFAAIIFIVIACIPNRAVHSLFGITDRAAKPPPAAPHVSPRGRMWAMLLALVFFVTGLGGLHRLYVGKVGTGILWLLSFGGCFGLGQVIDIIMLAAGRFTDREGRRVLIWTNPTEYRQSGGFPVAAAGGRAADLRPPQEGRCPNDPPPFPGNASANNLPPFARGGQGGVAVQSNELPSLEPASSLPDQPRPETSSGQASLSAVASPILAAFGMLVLLAGTVIGFAVAINLPAIIAAGIPDPQLAQSIAHDLDYSNWPQLLARIGVYATVSLLVASCGLLLIARRRSGGAHCLRAVLGPVAIGAGLSALSQATNRIPWPTVSSLVQADRIGPAIDAVLGTIRQETAMMSAVFLLISIVLLFWPAKHPEAISPRTAGGVA